MTPEEIQDRLAALSNKLNASNERLADERRIRTKLAQDLLSLFEAVTKLRRNDGS